MPTIQAALSTTVRACFRILISENDTCFKGFLRDVGDALSLELKKGQWPPCLVDVASVAVRYALPRQSEECYLVEVAVSRLWIWC